MADDVYFHLHDEDYDAAYKQNLFTAKDFIYSRNRVCLSLNGKWNFTVDLHDEGLRQKWYNYQACAPKDWADPRDYDPYMGEQIMVPSVWNFYQEKLYYFEGSAWYTKIIQTKNIPLSARYILRIGAAANEAFIFINGQIQGFHQGASTPFFCDITEFMASDEIRIQIVVRNTRRRQDVPMNHTDWFNYGGIHRDIEILLLPEVFIKNYFLHLNKDGQSAKIKVETSDLSDGIAHLKIDELACFIQIPIKQGQGEVQFALNCQKWSPKNPKLYEVSIEYQNDKITDKVGFRTIEAKGCDILLNGEKIFLKGISVHEDDEKLGRVATIDDIKRRISHAKELGCNFLRLAHYPHNELAAELCDAAGLMLWEEIPVYWAIAFDNADTLKNAQNQLSELIIRDQNRASVIMWSVGNENADTDLRLNFMRQLAETAKNLDETRLVTAACLVNFDELKIQDRLSEYLDVIGLNEYYGWYIPTYDDLITIGKNSNPGKPVIISETGAGAILGKDAPKQGWFSDDYMAEVYKNQTAIIPSVPGICGMTPWILYDFRAARRQNIYQKDFNRKGLITQDKVTKKQAFAILASFYNNLDNNHGE